MDAYSPTASSWSSSPAHIIYYFLAASSHSTINVYHRSFIAFYGYWSTSSGIFSSPASSCFTFTTIFTAGASSSPPEGIGYSFIATSSNDINTKPFSFPLLTRSPSTIIFLKAPGFERLGSVAARRGQHGHDYANFSTCIST